MSKVLLKFKNVEEHLIIMFDDPVSIVFAKDHSWFKLVKRDGYCVFYADLSSVGWCQIIDDMNLHGILPTPEHQFRDGSDFRHIKC